MFITIGLLLIAVAIAVTISISLVMLRWLFPAIAPTTSLRAWLDTLRVMFRERRWRQGEARYRQLLLQSELMATTRLVGRARPLNLDDIYTPPQLAWYQPALVKPSDIESASPRIAMEEQEALAQGLRLVIVGEAGAGKTTLVKHLVREIARQSRSWQAWVERLFPPGAEFPIPFYLELGHVPSLSDGFLHELAQDSFLRQALGNDALAFAQKRLATGACLIVCNGLDEILTEDRPHMLERLQELQKTIGGRNQVIMTTRAAGYHQDLAGFSELEILALDNYRIQQFLLKWFDGNQNKADQLWLALDTNPRLALLATNPLLLGIMAFMQESGVYRLPEEKASLYFVCSSALLQEWAIVSGKHWVYEFSRHFKHRVLEQVAYEFHCRRMRRFDLDTIQIALGGALSAVRDDFQGTTTGAFAVYLRSLFHLRRQLERLGRDREDYRDGLLYEQRLKENISLAQTFGDTKAREAGRADIIDRLNELGIRAIGKSFTEMCDQVEIELKQEQSASESKKAFLFLRNRTQRVDDRKEEQPTLAEQAQQLWHELYEWSGILHADSAEQVSFIHITFQEYFAAAHLHRRRLSAEELRTYIRDPWWQEIIVLRAGLRGDATDVVEAILSTEALRVPNDLFLAVRCLRDARQTPPASKRLVVERLLNWLLARPENLPQEYRGAMQDLGVLLDAPDWARITNLLRSSDDDFRQHGIKLLGLLAQSEALQPLLELLLDESDIVAKAAIQALATLGRPAVQPLIDIVRHPTDQRQRTRAVDALGWLDDPRALTPLIDIVREREAGTASAAAVALGRLGPMAVEPLMAMLDRLESADEGHLITALTRVGQPAIPRLLQALERENETVRRVATAALCGMGKVALEPAMFGINSQVAVKRQAVAEVLGYTDDDRAVPALITLLNDNLQSIRATAIAALVRLGSRTCESLIDVLMKDRSWHRRQGVATVLRQLGDDRSRPALMHAAGDRAWQVRFAAIEAIPRWPAAESLTLLVRCLSDQQAEVRKAAARALGHLGNSDAAQPLCDHLADRRSDVRVAIIEALAQLRNPLALEPLLKCLEDRNEQVQQAAIHAFSAWKDPRAIVPLFDALKRERNGAEAQKALVAYGSAAIPEVMKRLPEAPPILAQRLLHILAHNGDWDVAPVLFFLDAFDEYVRMAAIEALKQRPLPSVCARLLGLLNDGSTQVRLQAVRAVQEIACAAASEALCRCLRQEEEDWRVREALVDTLGDLGGVDAVSVLSLTLRNDLSEAVRVAAARSLGRLGGSGAQLALSQALGNDNRDNVREAVELAIRRITGGSSGDSRTESKTRATNHNTTLE